MRSGDNDNSQGTLADTLADCAGLRPGAVGVWGHGRVDACGGGIAEKADWRMARKVGKAVLSEWDTLLPVHAAGKLR